jgi:hypothetical protein
MDLFHSFFPRYGLLRKPHAHRQGLNVMIIFKVLPVRMHFCCS